MEEGTGESGLHHQALNDLGHSPFPFIFWSLWELDQVISRALLVLTVCGNLQRAEKAERRCSPCACMPGRAHRHGHRCACQESRGKGKGRRGLGRCKC